MHDLRTQYMGFTLKNPLVASSSPLTESLENLLRLEDAGIAAVVLPSLFEEQLTIESVALDEDLWRGAQEFAEAVTYLPDLEKYNTNPDGYLELIRRAKSRLSVPVFASLNGSTAGGWVRYARDIEQAGADGLELNLYAIETDVHRSGQAVEDDFCELVHDLKGRVKLPIAVKMTPFFSSIPHIAHRFDRAGVDALVLFNRFYQPDFDIETQEVVPRLVLSESSELLLRLHWIAILYHHVRPTLAVTGGVHSADDVLKCMMAGASVAMMTSALLKNGPRYVHRVLQDVSRWMMENEYNAVRQMQGNMSHRAVSNPAAFERGNYMKVLSSYSLRARP